MLHPRVSLAGTGLHHGAKEPFHQRGGGHRDGTPECNAHCSAGCEAGCCTARVNSIAARIMARHQGRLLLESSTARGSVFAVWLPIAQEAGG